jgi:hypothetical protein
LKIVLRALAISPALPSVTAAIFTGLMLVAAWFGTLVAFKNDAGPDRRFRSTGAYTVAPVPID